MAVEFGDVYCRLHIDIEQEIKQKTEIEKLFSLI